ncbi:MAG: ABC transporter ATP-binding protein [Methylococcales bacterium]|jgi:ATP-binding cassette, subfamily C, bacterial|nr:ABC transporter ATP-binding protein [Methylococcales bacterium]MBT7445253.1 ABC transporter ATP-binding protein [Methylococcales bacterium]
MQRYTWKGISKIAFHHKKALIHAHIIAIIAAIASVPLPLLLPLMVDEVLLDKPGTAVGIMNALFPESWHGPILYLLAILSISIILRLISLTLGVWQMRQFTIISKDIVFRIRKQLLRRLHRVSMSEYETMGSGKIASHLVTDLDAIDLFIGASISRFLVAILSLIGTAIVLIWIHWQLALFILLLNPIVIYFTTVMGKKVKQLKKHENSAYELFQDALAETLDAIQEVRAANRDKHYLQRVTDTAKNIQVHSCNFTWKSDAASRLSFVIFLFGFDMFRALSMIMVLYSDLSLGLMFAVFGYLWFMMSPVQELLGIQYAYHSASAALSRVNKLLDIPQEPRYPHQQNPFKLAETTDITLTDVSFAYGDGPNVLNKISLHIHAGEKIALVGASGGGKTTLVHVILGLYTPTAGDIAFNAISYKYIGLDVIRDNVATVLQHPALFNDSVRMNISLGENHSDAAIWQALSVAQLESTVHDLPEGLDTILGKRGVRLSGGQRQRLAIARMVLSDPKIVIMDEATSSLDTTTESKLHRALEAFLKNKTTLIIAHRLSAVRQADRALVFDGGQIIEDGHHTELINNNGIYAKLYGTQSTEN